jgi:lipid II:glycine glycyltransferase (peptidoglycan interpeptide bridge formation enzyme)
VAVHEAAAAELERWDDLAVRSDNGTVHQSRAWAAYREHFGWQPRFLVTDDGAPVLALARRWPLVGSDGIYVSRGPLPESDPAVTLRRLEAVTRWLGEHGASVVASDAEVPAASGYSALLAAAGFHPIEELQPSRHRLTVDLTTVRDESDLLAGFSATTRNMIRAAERSDLSTVVLGPVVGPAGGPDVGDAEAARLAGPTDLGARLAVLYRLMRATADRRGFGLASAERFADWSRRAFADGHLVYIAVHEPAGELVAGAAFYRHGRRWTYANAADDPRFRKAYPGAVRLVVWEAMKRALADGRTEMDLGGVDVRGARRRPLPGEPAHGMLTFKESFGARWLELTGAHERVLSPVRYGLGRITSRLAAIAGRGSG